MPSNRLAPVTLMADILGRLLDDHAFEPPLSRAQSALKTANHIAGELAVDLREFEMRSLFKAAVVDALSRSFSERERSHTDISLIIQATGLQFDRLHGASL